jgi:hypothetical protein
MNLFLHMDLIEDIFGQSILVQLVKFLVFMEPADPHRPRVFENIVQVVMRIL